MSDKQLHEFTVRVADDYRQEQGFKSSYTTRAASIEDAIADARGWFSKGVIVNVQAAREK